MYYYPVDDHYFSAAGHGGRMVDWLKKKIAVPYRYLYLSAFVLLLLPFEVFVITHLRTVWSVLLVILSAAAFYFLKKNMTEDDRMEFTVSSLMLLTGLIIIIAVSAGIGGYMPQKADHAYRNAVLYDLIHAPWPVTYSFVPQRCLVYYFNCWLVPALIGKLFLPFGSTIAMEAGFISLLLWTWLNILMVLLLVCRYLNVSSGKSATAVLLLLFASGGMDYIGWVVIQHGFWSKHFEWWTYCQYTAPYTQLAWVFNQAVPAWLCTTLLLNEKGIRRLGALVACCLIYAPFPAVGLAVIAAALVIRELTDAFYSGAVKLFLKELFSGENMLFCLAIVPVMGIFFLTNSTVDRVSDHGLITFCISDFYRFGEYVLFVILEFGLAALLLYRFHRNIFWWAIVVTLLILPLFEVISYDFCMRVSIPALFVLTVWLAEYFINYFREKSKADKGRFCALAVIFLLGLLTPFAELYTAVHDLIVGRQVRNDTIYSYANIFGREAATDNKLLGNFVSGDVSKTLFFDLLARKSSRTADSSDNQEVKVLLAEQLPEHDLAACTSLNQIGLFNWRNWLFITAEKEDLLKVQIYPAGGRRSEKKLTEKTMPDAFFEISSPVPGNGRKFCSAWAINKFEKDDLLVISNRNIEINDQCREELIRRSTGCGIFEYDSAIVVVPETLTGK